jgi:hypothetical protein
LLILNSLRYGKERAGFTAAELGWTLEDNELINHAIQAVGAKRYKVQRIYEKRLAPVASPGSGRS